MGFRGSKKNTPFAAQTAAEDAAKQHMMLVLEELKFSKRTWKWKRICYRTLHNNGLEVSEIIDVTPVPHNGCRPPKRRRV